MTSTNRLLLVEDERHLAVGLKINFEFEGFQVDIASTAREARGFLASGQSYAAIILDVSLPDEDGFSLCRQIRSAGDFIPVLMLTARQLAEDRVQGLESGADDYLTKPFDLDELIARVRSMLRRQAWNVSQKSAQPNCLEFGDARIDFDRHEAWMKGEQVKVTALELSLLRYFAINHGRALSRQELLEKVWKLGNYPNTRTVDNFVMRLRRQFEPDPSEPVYFLSVRGMGYKFSLGK